MKKNYATKILIALTFLFFQLGFSQTTTWTGASWDNGVPTITVDAIISSGNCPIMVDTEVKSIIIQDGAVLSVDESITLTIQDNIQVLGSGQFIVNNNASILQNNASAVNVGNITYNRDAMPMRQFEFTYWGSPVAGQVLNVFSPLTLSDKFYSYNANVGVNNWVIENQNNVMTPGKGYAIRAPQGYTSTPQVFSGQFIGTPNNGNVSANVVAFNPMLLNYNLLANPYPSAINVVTLFDNSNLGTLYFWTHNSAITSNVFTSDDYAIRTRTTGTAAVTGGTAPGIYVAAGQAFFASAGTTTTINFTNAMRVAGNNSQFYRTVQDLPLNYYFHLNMTNTLGAFKQIAVGYQEDATNGYDFDKEEAAYYLNDLENLINDQDVLFYPSSYRRPYQIEETDNANILLRAEVLNRINSRKKPSIIVTYPEALFEKVVTRKELDKNTLKVAVADQISIDFINEVLFEYNFKRVDFVSEPGEFSVRGGIIDVFSFSNDNPYRIEFFGNEVDSIRTFDVETQLSLEKQKKIAIIPNVENKFLQENRESFLIISTQKPFFLFRKRKWF
jgi:hypothetical protein